MDARIRDAEEDEDEEALEVEVGVSFLDLSISKDEYVFFFPQCSSLSSCKGGGGARRCDLTAGVSGTAIATLEEEEEFGSEICEAFFQEKTGLAKKNWRFLVDSQRIRISLLVPGKFTL